MRTRLIVIAAALLSGLGDTRLQAHDDWLGLRVPQKNFSSTWECSLEWAQAQRNAWSPGGNQVALLDSDGKAKILRAMDLTFGLLWQAGVESLALRLPYVIRELSPRPDGSNPSFALNDPALRRGDGNGDLTLGYRRALGQGTDNRPLAGVGLDLTAPLGLGPMESQHPLVATGDGRWKLSPQLSLGGAQGRLQGWLQVGGQYQFGREADVSTQAVFSYGGQGALKLPPGRTFLGPRWGLNLGAGLSWDWHSEEAMRHSLALELRQQSLSPWVIDGGDVPGSDSESIEFIPQLQARFLGHFQVVAGWVMPPVVARNRAVSTSGEWRLRVELML